MGPTQGGVGVSTFRLGDGNQSRLLTLDEQKKHRFRRGMQNLGGIYQSYYFQAPRSIQRLRCRSPAGGTPGSGALPSVGGPPQACTLDIQDAKLEFRSPGSDKPLGGAVTHFSQGFYWPNLFLPPFYAAPSADALACSKPLTLLNYL